MPIHHRDHFMRAALEQAQLGFAQGEVPVGAVVVKDDEIIARAYNQPIGSHDPSAHAEIVAIRRACEKIGNYRLVGCDLYVTLEPCMMCTGAILQARIQRLFYGALEPKTGAVKSAFQLLTDARQFHKITAVGGILAEDSAQLLQSFFVKARQRHRERSTQTAHCC